MAELRDRKDMWLEAGLILASELSLPIVLQRIVDLAAQVADARYGALGVIGDANTLVEFVTTGMPARQRRAIGALPTGHGVLGLLLSEPRRSGSRTSPTTPAPSASRRTTRRCAPSWARRSRPWAACTGTSTLPTSATPMS